MAKQEEEEWACSLCTLINRPINKYCDACMSPRPEGKFRTCISTEMKISECSSYLTNSLFSVPKEPTKLEHSPLSRDLIRYPCNSFSKPLQEIKMNCKTAFGTTTLVLTSLSAKPDSPSSPAINQAHTLETMRGLSTHSNGQWSPSNGVSGMQFKGNVPRKRESPADHSQPNKRMKTTNGLSGGSMQHIGSSRRVQFHLRQDVFVKY